MDLYCWPHNTTHQLTAGEVEQVVYVLTGALATEEKSEPIQDPNEYPNMICPQTALELARDSEAYLEHTEQGVESRKAMTK
jgi:hypothetical protein